MISQSDSLFIVIERKSDEIKMIIKDKDTSLISINPRCSMDHGIELKSNLSDGKYYVFYNDTLSYIGIYKDKLRDGVWIHYKKDGMISYKEKYIMGRLIKGE